MLDDDLFEVDLVEVLAAIESTGAQPPISAIEELPRVDVFSGFRNPNDLTIAAAGLPWSAPGEKVLDFYKPLSGWMSFLEIAPDTLAVRQRHEDVLTEPSKSKTGVLLMWKRDHPDFLRLQQIVHSAIAEGRSPLYDLVLNNELPDVFANPLRERLSSPLDTSLTVAGDLVFPARSEILRVLVSQTIYLRNPT